MKVSTEVLKQFLKNRAEIVGKQTIIYSIISSSTLAASFLYLHDADM
jgi:hypothetical protein